MLRLCLLCARCVQFGNQFERREERTLASCCDSQFILTKERYLSLLTSKRPQASKNSEFLHAGWVCLPNKTGTHMRELRWAN